MRNHFYSALFFFSLWAFSSCTIKEEIYFNKDMSGKLRYSVDLSMFKAFAKSMEEEAKEEGENQEEEPQTDTESSGNMVDSLINNINPDKFYSIPGISSVVVNTSNTDLLEISLEFADLTALNRIYHELRYTNNNDPTQDKSVPIPPSEVFESFSMNGKKLSYAVRPTEAPEEGSEEVLAMEGMSEMMDFETYFYFENTIKSVKSEVLSSENDAKSVVFKYTSADLMKPKGELIEAEIVLK